jgi:chromosomal replication initiator protein
MLSIKHVQTIVTEQFGLTCAQLLGRSHLPRIVLARHIAMLLCLEMVRGASLPVVGQWFGRDHTTVLHARERMRRRIAVDRRFAKQVEALRQIISKAARSLRHHRGLIKRQAWRSVVSGSPPTARVARSK